MTLDFELAAIEASILGATVIGTAVEQADSSRSHVDPPNPFDTEYAGHAFAGCLELAIGLWTLHEGRASRIEYGEIDLSGATR